MSRVSEARPVQDRYDTSFREHHCYLPSFISPSVGCLCVSVCVCMCVFSYSFLSPTSISVSSLLSLLNLASEKQDDKMNTEEHLCEFPLCDCNFLQCERMHVCACVSVCVLLFIVTKRSHLEDTG